MKMRVAQLVATEVLGANRQRIGARVVEVEDHQRRRALAHLTEGSIRRPRESKRHTEVGGGARAGLEIPFGEQASPRKSQRLSPSWRAMERAM